MSLVFANFESLQGGIFDIPHPESGEVYVSLTLTQVKQSGKGHLGREIPFSLMFEGPSSHGLDQGTFAMKNDALGMVEIFIVPISDNGEIRQYQAVFN